MAATFAQASASLISLLSSLSISSISLSLFLALSYIILARMSEAAPSLLGCVAREREREKGMQGRREWEEEGGAVMTLHGEVILHDIILWSRARRASSLSLFLFLSLSHPHSLSPSLHALSEGAGVKL